MSETRYFIIIVPDEMTRASYMGLKITFLAVYAFGML